MTTPRRPARPGPGPQPQIQRTQQDLNLATSVARYYADVVRHDEIRNPTDYVAFATCLLQTRSMAKYVKQRTEAITEPAKALTKTAKDWFGKTQEELDVIESRLKALMEAYVDKRVHQAAAESTAALQAGDTQGMLQAMSAVPAVPGIGLSTVVDFEVDSEFEIPSEYWKREIDATKVRKALRAGQHVPGVTRVERTQVSVSAPPPAPNLGGAK